MSIYSQDIQNALAYINENVSITPDTAVILGSGLGSFAEQLTDLEVIKFTDIPHFPISTVVGHEGKLVFGKLGEKSILAIQGRVHLYEGYSPSEVIFPIRLYHSIGIRKLIVTNAAGCTNTAFNAGDLMLITDQINFTFRNPLIGKNNDKLGPRFPDMSEPYSKDLIQLAEKIALKNKINIKKGVYLGLLGPSYETPAEIRMIQQLGGDAVGMSTVHDVIAARHLGMKVLGISCLTNMGAGLSQQTLSHNDVTETANLVKDQFIKLLSEISLSL